MRHPTPIAAPTSQTDNVWHVRSRMVGSLWHSFRLRRPNMSAEAYIDQSCRLQMAPRWSKPRQSFPGLFEPASKQVQHDIKSKSTTTFSSMQSLRRQPARRRPLGCRRYGRLTEPRSVTKVAKTQKHPSLRYAPCGGGGGGGGGGEAIALPRPPLSSSANLGMKGVARLHLGCTL